MSLNSTTILITGGLGQIGLAIVLSLRTGHPTASLHVLDLQIPNTKDIRYVDGVKYHEGNITDRSAVKILFEQVRPEVIFHTAGLIPQIAVRLGLDTEKDYMNVNVEGTRILLDEATSVGSVKAFVFTSSADVVKGNSWLDLKGVGEEMRIPEVFDGWYAESKAKAETLVLSSSSPSAFSTTALRTHGVFSANDRNILPLFLTAPRNIRLGPGNNLYDFTYAPNLAHAHILAAENLLDMKLEGEKSATGQAFFVTNNEPVKFKEFLGWIYEADDDDADGSGDGGGTEGEGERRGKKKEKVREIPVRVAKPLVWLGEKASKMIGKKPMITFKELGDSVAERWFDNRRAREVLGYIPAVGLKEGVRLAVEGYKKVQKDEKQREKGVIVEGDAA